MEPRQAGGPSAFCCSTTYGSSCTASDRVTSCDSTFFSDRIASCHSASDRVTSRDSTFFSDRIASCDSTHCDRIPASHAPPPTTPPPSTTTNKPNAIEHARRGGEIFVTGQLSILCRLPQHVTEAQKAVRDEPRLNELGCAIYPPGIPALLMERMDNIWQVRVKTSSGAAETLWGEWTAFEPPE